MAGRGIQEERQERRHLLHQQAALESKVLEKNHRHLRPVQVTRKTCGCRSGSKLPLVKAKRSMSFGRRGHSGFSTCSQAKWTSWESSSRKKARLEVYVESRKTPNSTWRLQQCSTRWTNPSQMGNGMDITVYVPVRKYGETPREERCQSEVQPISIL